MIDKFPKLRKLTLNTTGLTPHRAIPMLTKVVEMCHERNVIFSTRVSIDGVNDMHGEVRNVKRAFEKAGKTIAAMQELQKTLPLQLRHLVDDLLEEPRRRRQHPGVGEEGEARHRLQHGALHRRHAGQRRARRARCKPMGAEEQRMRKFFLDRVRQDPLLDGQNYIYMHYADMIANGYHRTGAVPVPDPGHHAQPERRPVLLREQRRRSATSTKEDPEAIYFREAAQAHRTHIRDEKCPTCLSPCQMNVAAIKQVVPYARFLVRASMEKRRSSASIDSRSPHTRPSPHVASGRIRTVGRCIPRGLSFGRWSPPASLRPASHRRSSSLPGMLILRAIAPRQGWLPVAAFGPLVGQALGYLVHDAAVGRRRARTVAPDRRAADRRRARVPAATAARPLALPQSEPGDAVALALLLILVPLVVGLPFAHVGEMTPDGQAYRAYFTADYVWRRAVVIELAKGAPMPVNPYFAGDALHYYWMPHMLSGVQYRFAGAWATLDELLLIRSIAIDLFFVAFLYGIGAAVPRPAVGGSGGRGIRHPLDEFRRAVCPVRFLVEERADRRGEEPQHRRDQPLVFPGHPDRRPAAAALLPTASHRRLRDRPDRPARAGDPHARRWMPRRSPSSGVCLGLSIAISSFAG